MANVVSFEPDYYPNPDKSRALAGGKIYVGIVDLDPTVLANQKQISVILECGDILEVSQPIYINSGGVPVYNGTPVTIIVDGPFSMAVLDSAGSQVYYMPKNSETTNDLITVETIADLRSTTGDFQNQAANVLGYYAAGDGGGGPERIWGTAGGYVDNGGSVIVPTGGDGSAAWLFSDESNIDAIAFGIIGDGSLSIDTMLTRVTAYWQWALTNTKDLYFNAGLYEIGQASFPWRQQIVTALLDCKNITLHAAGPATIFKTTSGSGADVFQLNGLKNFHVKGFPTLTAELTGTAGAGSNGCSVTNGFDNITLEITPTDCQSIDKGTYIDGGKGFTIQTPTVGATLECGTLSAFVNAKGCAGAFDMSLDLVASQTKKTSVNVDLVAEDCYQAVAFSAGAAVSALTAGIGNGIVVRGQAINCQRDVALSRCHGADINMQVITTKSAAQRRLDPQGVAWRATDTIVEAFRCSYAKNTIINIDGNKGACDYKGSIGGITAGSSGLTGETKNCHIYLDIGGTASTSDLLAVNAGGNIMSDSILIATTRTTTSAFPALFTDSTYGNTTMLGTAERLVNLKVASSLSLAFNTDGTTETGKIFQSGFITAIQGKATASTNSVVTGLYDYAGNFRLGCLNKNGIAVDGISTASAIGTYVGKYSVFDISGTLLGYFPLYN